MTLVVHSGVSVNHKLKENMREVNQVQFGRPLFPKLFIKYHILNTLKTKCDINQQDLKRVDLHFIKSE